MTLHVARITRRGDGWPLPAAIVAGLFVLYASTAPATLALEDDGLFAMASALDGVAHPPGYPLFTWLGHLATGIPLGGVAWRLHLLSALCGALACGVLLVIVRRLTGSAVAATAAALAFGLSAAWWSQAIIAEVYTLNLLLSLLLFRLLLDWDATPTATASGHPAAGLAGLLYGLGLSNHWPLLLLFSPAFLVLAWGQLVRRPVLLLTAACGSLLGLVPYLRMIWRSQGEDAISYDGPIASVAELVATIARRRYAVTDADPFATAADAWAFTWYQLGELATQLSPAGALLALLGVVAASCPARVRIALVAGIAGTVLPLLLLLERQFDPLNVAIYRVYPLAAYAALAILAGCGLHWLLERLDLRTPWSRGLCRVLPLLLALLPLLNSPGVNLRREYDWAERYAKALLAVLPKDAVLLTVDDVDTFTIGYARRVLGLRPDVQLYQRDGLVLAPRLFDPRNATPEQRRAALLRLLGDRSRPVCTPGQSFMADARPPGVIDLGLVRCVSPRVPEGKRLVRLDRETLDAYRALSGAVERDAWTRMAQANLDALMIPALVAVLGGAGEAPGISGREIAAALERATRHPFGLLTLLDARETYGNPVPAARALAMLETAGHAPRALYTSRLRVGYLLRRARLLLDLDRGSEAEAVLLEAVALAPTWESAALDLLLGRYRARGDLEALDALLERYPHLGARKSGEVVDPERRGQMQLGPSKG